MNDVSGIGNKPHMTDKDASRESLSDMKTTTELCVKGIMALWPDLTDIVVQEDSYRFGGGYRNLINSTIHATLTFATAA